MHLLEKIKYQIFSYFPTSAIAICHFVILYIEDNKTFRERQHPRPAEIRKYEHWLSVAISNSDPRHGTLHHTTKFQAEMWFPCISKYESSSWSRLMIEKFRGTRKNWPSKAILKSDLLHGTVHHSTKFQADSWNPPRVRAVTSFLRPAPSLYPPTDPPTDPLTQPHHPYPSPPPKKKKKKKKRRTRVKWFFFFWFTGIKLWILKFRFKISEIVTDIIN